MKVHRFYIKQSLGEEEIEISNKDLLHQFINVLKFKLNENIILFNNLNNIDYIYQIKSVSKQNLKLLFIKKEKNLNQIEEKEKIINLCFSLIKKENVNIILEKCAELGVLNFYPLISERTEKKNILSFNKKRNEKILIESIEQSGWGNLPKIFEIEKLENILKRLENKGEIENIFIMDILNYNNNNNNNLNFHNFINKNLNQNIYLFVGPEGGWSENERKLFEKYKLKIISFGKNTLRAETASIIGGFYFLNF